MNNLIFSPLTQEMSADIFTATYGNVADYFHPFSGQQAADNWVEVALAEIKSGEKIEYAVYTNSVFVGLISLRDLKTSTPEFGLWIHPAHQGKGLGSASMKWLISWANENLPHAEKLIYDADAENVASNALAISAGLIFEKEYKDGNVTYKRYTFSL